MDFHARPASEKNRKEKSIQKKQYEEDLKEKRNR
jgi:hypothetical protein